MSATRSAAAAQRRRTTVNDTPISRTSISSAPAFSQPPAIRPGTTAKIAGQQAAYAQQQQQQQQYQQQNSATSSVQAGSSAKPKMTVPQAITLITLRLGRVESQLQNLDLQNLADYGTREDDATTDQSVIDRLESLEKLVLTMKNDLPNFKQQIDLLKPATVSVKNISAATSKEVKDLKVEVEKLKEELANTLLLLGELQQKIDTSEPIDYDLNLENTVEFSTTIEEEELVEEEDVELLEESSTSLSDLQGIQLKEIIEQELLEQHL